MSSTNINDPAAVTALLEQLKASAAWQELTANTSSNSAAASPQPPSLSSSNINEHHHRTHNESNASSISGTSVASLLSQLKPFSTASGLPTSDFGYGDVQGASVPNTLPFAPPPSSIPRPSVVEPNETRASLTFGQSLPILSELVEDAAFVTAIKTMKKDQHDLERQLWAEREAIYTKYHEKFKVALTKAQMIGTIVSQHEQDMMMDAFKKEIYQFDRDRAIPAWDGLVSRQQLELAQIQVPTMFVTGEVQDRQTAAFKRQQQVINVLETIVGAKAA